jgi:hypothetical protein
MCLPLVNTQAHDVEKLAAACQPATFGRNNETVLDETYRKAGKMDITDFAIHFCPDRLGLTDQLRRAFIQADDSCRIKAELYKLNVYGTSSLF